MSCRPALDIDNYTAEDIKDMLKEAIHQDFDGWTDWDRATIVHFLGDILNAIDAVKKEG